MTPAEYRTALSTLGLTIQAAGRWLNVSPKTAQGYATNGPSGPAARAVGMAVALKGMPWVHGALETIKSHDGSTYRPLLEYVRHSDLTAAVGLPDKEK